MQSSSYTAEVLTINGFEVKFPFTAYECQKQMMEKMLESFKTRQNLILESPTGTGKCMAALASCYSYLNTYKASKANQEAIRIFTNYKSLITKLNSFKKQIHFKKLNNYESKFYYKEAEIEKNNNQIKQIDDFLETLMQSKKEITDLIAYNANDSELVQKTKKFIKSLIDELRKKIFRMENIPPSFIYCVRTASQIDVVFDELQKANGINFFSTAFLKSRNFHCLNENLKSHNNSNEDLIAACKRLRENKIDIENKQSECIHYNNIQNTFVDVEYDKNLSNYSKGNKCAYYGELKKVENSELIICNYNYILQPKSLKLLQDYVFNPIIIVDEAHNFISCLEDNYKNELSIETLLQVLDDLETLYNLEYKEIEKTYQLKEVEKKFRERIILKDIESIYKLVFYLIKNLVFLNQRRFEINEIRKHEEYNGYFIFYLFFILFSKSFIDSKIKTNENNFVDFQYDSNFYENQELKTEFYKEVISSLKEGKEQEMIINLDNHDLLCKAMENIEEKLFDHKQKNKTSIKKLKNLIKFFFASLFENFYKSVYVFDSNSSYIDDYFLLLNDNVIMELTRDQREDLYSELNAFAKVILRMPEISLNKLLEKKDKTLGFIKSKIGLMQGKKCSLICLNPSIGFKRIKKTFGDSTVVNLMSGTLSPFDFYQFQLRTEFPLKLETNHIVSKSNVNIMLFTEPIIKVASHENNILNDYLIKKFILLDKEAQANSQNNIYKNNNNLNTEYYDDEQNYNDFTNSGENSKISCYSANFIYANSLEKLSFSQSNSQGFKKGLLMSNIIKIIFDFSHACLTGNLVFFKSYEMISNFRDNLIKELESNGITYQKDFHNMILKIPFDELFPEVYTGNQTFNYQTNNTNNKSLLGYKTSRNQTQRKFLNLFFDISTKMISKKNEIIFQYKQSCEENLHKNFLFTVMRGSLSEGVNFKNNESTSVFIIGVPFASFNDPIIMLKRNYLDEKAKKNTKIESNQNNNCQNNNNNFNDNKNILIQKNTNNIIPNNKINEKQTDFVSASASNLIKKVEKEAINNNKTKNGFHNNCPLKGSEWYSLDAINSLNQAIGRAIRSKNDFANVILIDDQFLNYQNSKYFSKWINEIDEDKLIIKSNNYYDSIKKAKCFLEKNDNKGFGMK